MAGQVPIGQNKLIPSGLFLFGAPVVSLAGQMVFICRYLPRQDGMQAPANEKNLSLLVPP
jgi:hypothetical protein